MNYIESDLSLKLSKLKIHELLCCARYKPIVESFQRPCRQTFVKRVSAVFLCIKSCLDDKRNKLLRVNAVGSMAELICWSSLMVPTVVTSMRSDYLDV